MSAAYLAKLRSLENAIEWTRTLERSFLDAGRPLLANKIAAIRCDAEQELRKMQARIDP